MPQAFDPGEPSEAVQRSPSVEDLLRQYSSDGPVTSGTLIDKLIGTHRYYLADELVPEPVAARGLSRTVADHVETAQRRWDNGQIVKFSGRHLLLALTMDADVGWPLLRSGMIASILTRWQPDSQREPHRLVWDVLSQEGRELAEEQPLLAAACGAPSEWTAELPEPVTMLALAPAADRVAVLAGGTVYELVRGSVPRRVNDVDGKVVSIGWGRDGMIALRTAGDTAEITRI